MHAFAASEIRDYLSGYDSQPYEYDYYVDKQWVRTYADSTHPHPHCRA